jgi:hypothetical protein
MEQLPPGFQIDDNLSKQMGTTVAVNPTTGKRIRWNGGTPGGGDGLAGTTPRPEYGQGAYETTDGSILRPTKGGAVQVMRGAQTAGAEARARLALGLGPTIEAQKNLYETEVRQGGMGEGGGNPLDSLRGALGEWLTPENPNNSILTRMSKNVGGQRYQDYQQAAKSFEAAFMPILSGAAVTDSEAKRLIAASLPQPGDTTQTLNRKARNRAMMINAAAELLGRPRPFPLVGSFDFKSGQEVPGGEVDLGTLRKEAAEAIRKGAPRDKVLARFSAMAMREKGR